jgi:hypothetical protein
MGLDPVMVAVLATVLDHANPRPPVLQNTPEVREGFDRHIRMAHDVVGLTDQFAFGKTADHHKFAVDVGDLPLQISLRDDQTVLRQLKLALCDWHVDFHFSFLMGQAF